MAENKDKKVLNVPALRFPKFSGEWKREILNDVCTFHNGRAYKQNELLSDGKYRVLRVGNFFTNDSWYYSDLELDDEKVAVNGDLLYAWSASFGPRFWTGEKVIYHYHIWKIDSFQQVSKEFLFYFLERDTEKIKNEVQGGTMVHITKGDMEKREILYPSILEQSKIARLLSLLDERIATQNKIIEDLKKLKSAIRKRVFTLLKNEHTESCEINQLLAYEQPNTYIVVNDEYSADTTLTPVLTANKGFVLGYTDEDFGIYQKGECIIFDDFTMDAKYVSFPFKVKSSAIKILTAKLNVNLRFMFEYLSYLGLKSEEHKRHYISEIASLVIELPSKEKQNRIANLMTSLDNKLVLEEKVKAKYEDKKQYLLSQMFI
ncbi:restriction endonuclease subunit S [Parabacteroides distasonis]|uniref:restriction endonuclease subunit S n=1 Tax=Parabacteroides distasonis TaxID=823 RepID=UPI0015620CF4|nr:restriction endonuclease subunit S [Parabacteroides distasonis]